MTPDDTTDLTPAERVDDVPRILRALRRGVREALRQHKISGHPVAIWRNHRVVWIEPEDIPVSADTEEPQDDARTWPSGRAGSD